MRPLFPPLSLRIGIDRVTINYGHPVLLEAAAVNQTHALIGLIFALLFVAVIYTRKQIRMLRRTTPQYEMLPDERRFLRGQAWRRLANSGLMIVLAGLMMGAFSLNERADELGNRRAKLREADGVAGKMTDEDRAFSRLYSGYWITCLLMLGAILALAGIDLMATRRYALRKLRQIQTDRRAMLQRQLERYRQERGGGNADL